MTLKEIESALMKANIDVKEFRSMTDYCIKLDGGGAIHLGWKGNIVVMGKDSRVEELCNILGVDIPSKKKYDIGGKQNGSYKGRKNKKLHSNGKFSSKRKGNES